MTNGEREASGPGDQDLAEHLGERALPATLAAASPGHRPAQLPEEGCYLAVVPEGVVVVGGSAAGSARPGPSASSASGQMRAACVCRSSRSRTRPGHALPRHLPGAASPGNPDRLARAKYCARLKLNAVVMEDALL